MCELLDRVEEKGRQEGIKQGIKEGAFMVNLESIRCIMEGLKYSSEQAMDLLKIPAEDRQEYAAKL